MGKVADEADCVAEEHRPPARQPPPPRPCVERGEELVLGQFVGAGERVEERALARVGVADERDRHAVVAGGHLPFATAMDLGEFCLQIVDSFFDEPAVDFQLFLTRAAHPDAHFETG